jgi:NAD(P)-dependent dehydrogenase (short-subunit alcohol dehydrogenase family)
MSEKSIFDLSGRVAVVTGGGGGLGRAFCEAMAEFGADVACVDCDEPKAKETVTLIKRFGHRAIAIKADVSKPEQVEKMVTETVAKFGTIDILVNNAGILGKQAKIYQTSIDSWDRVIAVNLKGEFLCMRAVLPVMLRQKRGSIINISSNCAYGPGNPVLAPAAYGASKAGIINLTKQGAIEHVKDGIRVNAIAPGMFDTNIAVESDPELEAKRKQVVQETIDNVIPMGRQAQPSEIKGLAVYLASDASSYVTGQVFIADGGQSARV